MNNKDSNGAINDSLMLGIGILIIGLILAIYSISSYLEVKTLSEKIDFELIEGDMKTTSTDKYFEYQAIAEFLNKKLNKNKNIPLKNVSCVYLDYAEHNAILMYNLADKKLESDISKRSTAAGNIRDLHKILDNYKTCKQTAKIKQELENQISEIENASKQNSQRADRMTNFLNGYKENQNINNEVSETQIPTDEGFNGATTKDIEQDIDNMRQWEENQ